MEMFVVHLKHSTMDGNVEVDLETLDFDDTSLSKKCAVFGCLSSSVLANG